MATCHRLKKKVKILHSCLHLHKMRPPPLQLRVSRGADGRPAGAGERAGVAPQLGGGREVANGGRGDYIN